MSTPAPEPQQEVRIPDWVINLVGRQALELEMLRQAAAAKAGAETTTT